MKRSWLGLLGLVGLVAVFATTGCGSSSSSGPSDSDVTMSCNVYCDAYAAEACPTPIYASAAECKTMDCDMLPTGAPSGCRAALKAYYDCEKAQQDICADTGCTDQAAAFFTACGG
jgi:hypothetical protein